jgi:hypothetical protein
VAFWGGIFAGALKLDMAEEPLRGWVQRTAGSDGDGDDAGPPPPAGGSGR